MSKPYIPSNGTEGMIFRERFCDECKHDHKYLYETTDPEDACQIFNATLLHNPGDAEYPKEWIRVDDNDIVQGGTCTAFERFRESDGIKQEPKDTVTIDMFEML